MPYNGVSIVGMKDTQEKAQSMMTRARQDLATLMNAQLVVMGPDNTAVPLGMTFTDAIRKLGIEHVEQTIAPVEDPDGLVVATPKLILPH